MQVGAIKLREIFCLRIAILHIDKSFVYLMNRINCCRRALEVHYLVIFMQAHIKDIVNGTYRRTESRLICFM